MLFIWILVGMPALALMFAAYVATTEDRGEISPSYVSSAGTSGTSRQAFEAKVKPKRPARQITMYDFDRLLRHWDDVVFLDLTPYGRREQAISPVAHTLFVDPKDLAGLFQWLPPNTSVVLLGSEAFCATFFAKDNSFPGSAPIYLLARPQEMSI